MQSKGCLDEEEGMSEHQLKRCFSMSEALTKALLQKHELNLCLSMSKALVLGKLERFPLLEHVKNLCLSMSKALVLESALAFLAFLAFQH